MMRKLVLKLTTTARSCFNRAYLGEMNAVEAPLYQELVCPEIFIGSPAQHSDTLLQAARKVQRIAAQYYATAAIQLKGRLAGKTAAVYRYSAYINTGIGRQEV